MQKQQIEQLEAQIRRLQVRTYASSHNGPGAARSYVFSLLNSTGFRRTMCLLLLQTYHASLMPLGAITKSNSVTTLSKSLTLFYTPVTRRMSWTCPRPRGSSSSPDLP